MYNIFVELLQQHNTTPYQVAKATGVSNGCLSDWKRGRSTPKYDALSKIADYFGVSVEYLLGKEKKPTENDELLKQVEQANSNMAVIIGKGMDRKVVQVPPEAEAIIKSAIEAFEKNNK